MTAATPSAQYVPKRANPLPGPIIQIAVLAAGLAASVVFGYIRVFSRFAPYDDEGYLMISVRQFLEGMPLYDEVFTQYGPFYYICKLAFFKLLGTAVTHDITRLTTLAIWIVFASLCAFFAYRQTRSLNWTLICYLQCFFHASALTNEPGHPQELVILLLAAIIVVAALLPGRTSGLAFIGVFAALILFTKINIGVYVAVSVGMALLALCPRRPIILGLALLSAVAAVAVPPAVMSRHLADWGGSYAAVVSLTVAACCIAALQSPGEERLRLGQPLWAAGGFVAAAVIVTGLALRLGSSPAGLLDGVLLRPLRFAGAFSFALHLPPASPGIALISLAAAICCFHLLRKEIVARRTLNVIFAACKVAVGVSGMCFGGLFGHELMSWTAPFLWVVLLPPVPGSWRLEQLFPRMILCLVAALQLMAAYPVAGSQVAWSTVLLFPVLVLCLSDAFAVVADRIQPAVRDVGPVLLLAITVWWYFPPLRTGTDLAGFRSLTPLGLPGAQRVRLSAEQAAAYQWLSSTLRANCDAFITLPGYQSLHFWSGVQPVTGLNTTLWPLLLTRGEKQRVVDRLRDYPRACAVYYAPNAPGWLSHPPPASSEPLVNYISDSFRTVNAVSGYNFMIRKDRVWP